MRNCAKTFFATNVNAFSTKMRLFQGSFPHMEILKKMFPKIFDIKNANNPKNNIPK